MSSALTAYHKWLEASGWAVVPVEATGEMIEAARKMDMPRADNAQAMVARSMQMDPPKKRLTFAEARAIRIRCAEGVRKIFHGDQPVQVDHTIQGVRLVEQIGEVRERNDKLIECVAKVLPIKERGDDA